MGVLLIIGIVALGYFADLENTGNNTNNTTNNTTKNPFFPHNNLTDQQSISPDQSQPTSDTTSSSDTTQNSTTNSTQNNTVSGSSSWINTIYRINPFVHWIRI